MNRGELRYERDHSDEVPQSLRAEHHYEDPDENFALLRKWADPQLPDPYGNSYSQEYTIADLKRLFGATYSRF